MTDIVWVDSTTTPFTLLYVPFDASEGLLAAIKTGKIVIWKTEAIIVAVTKDEMLSDAEWLRRLQEASAWIAELEGYGFTVYP